ncbi:ImmA/IrrE family metallo-endopeptidase [Geodermatophilus sp. DF01-2]|uniref:ImmA/IrrE family metallo-endopeptidase n=1 Tax=Geodermatophilus sp. DF01-2 TaxID=2559610 RepID=UPI001431C9D4|nr:ImmA/IrrE family metallo-endopeptidase [Geodermatophilus sp. DF01_2]
MRDDQPPSVLSKIRSLVPDRPLRFSEAIHLAELQALRFLELTGNNIAPVPTSVVTTFPRIRVIDDPTLPIAGASHWNGSLREWVIRLNPTDSGPQRRFTLLHEFKHIIDFGAPGLRQVEAHPVCCERHTELVADHFATCVLLPKARVREVWATGTCDAAAIAARFDVPMGAARVRLAQLGLLDAEVSLNADNGDQDYPQSTSNRAEVRS